MLIGYARVSTQDQDNAAQIAALKSAGCELIFQEKATGGRWERPELHRLLGATAQRRCIGSLEAGSPLTLLKRRADFDGKSPAGGSGIPEFDRSN